MNNNDIFQERVNAELDFYINEVKLGTKDIPTTEVLDLEVLLGTNNTNDNQPDTEEPGIEVLMDRVELGKYLELPAERTDIILEDDNANGEIQWNKNQNLGNDSNVFPPAGSQHLCELSKAQIVENTYLQNDNQSNQLLHPQSYEMIPAIIPTGPTQNQNDYGQNNQYYQFDYTANGLFPGSKLTQPKHHCGQYGYVSDCQMAEDPISQGYMQQDNAYEYSENCKNDQYYPDQFVQPLSANNDQNCILFDSGLENCNPSYDGIQVIRADDDNNIDQKSINGREVFPKERKADNKIPRVKRARASKAYMNSLTAEQKIARKRPENRKNYHTHAAKKEAVREKLEEDKKAAMTEIENNEFEIREKEAELHIQANDLHQNSTLYPTIQKVCNEYSRKKACLSDNSVSISQELDDCDVGKAFKEADAIYRVYLNTEKPENVLQNTWGSRKSRAKEKKEVCELELDLVKLRYKLKMFNALKKHLDDAREAIRSYQTTQNVPNNLPQGLSQTWPLPIFENKIHLQDYRYNTHPS